VTGSLAISVVFLTGYSAGQGHRPDEIARAIDCVRAQEAAPTEIVLVVNGGSGPAGLPAEVKLIELPENVGIPAGRNIGWRATGGDLVVFLDDDGWLPDPGTFGRAASRFAAEPRLGILAFRIVDPDTGATQRRHVPRLRAGDPLRSGDVTTFLGGAWMIRREVLERTGGLPDSFFFAHEETDLAWRALDLGWRIRYDADCVLLHPATSPARHALYYRTNARNRVWLAKRNLPVPVGVAYVAVWLGLTLARVHDLRALRAWFAGLLEGVRRPAGQRRPMRWRTVWRMARLGRPPVI
jgi:GT2 family glycosyltransferase